jgi:adenylyl-sulfate kinase
MTSFNNDGKMKSAATRHQISEPDDQRTRGSMNGSDSDGFVLWFTGLSGSGKTTLAKLIEQELKERGVRVERLDGDVVRQSLTADLGFSKEDRDKNIERVTFVAKLLSRNGVGVLASFISPYRTTRDWVSNEVTNFIEVFVECPVEACIQRDVKGLYAKAVAGEIPEFTGVSDPYEPPLSPEITVHTADESIEESFARIMDYLEKERYVPARELAG